MKNFDTELDKKIISLESRVVVHAEVNLIKRSVRGRAYLAKSDEDWTWQDLRDYVFYELDQRFGVVFVDPADQRWNFRVAGIFKGFLNSWGDKAPKIARYIFEVCDGMWEGKPMSISSFTKAYSSYWAHPISLRIFEGTTSDW